MVSCRNALLTDLSALLQLENQCFTADQISRRSFRRFIEDEKDIVLLAEVDGRIAGYCLTLIHQATRVARVYSLAVNPDFRGQRIGEKLVSESEKIASTLGRIFMRLEVRKDNNAAIQLYQRMGYRQFGFYPHYYEDQQDALRFQKRIVSYHPTTVSQHVPYYGQTTDFTCGSAALMMAMAAASPNFTMSQDEEIQIWREATTVFMLSGNGGCGPRGLAIAATRRGFPVDIYVNREGPLFTSTVRSPEKKQIITLVHKRFVREVAELGIPLFYEDISLYQLRECLARGEVPVVLISTWQLEGNKLPHWVTVCDIDDKFVYIHDPSELEEGWESLNDRQFIPIEHAAFKKMARYGQSVLRAAIIIKAPLSNEKG